MGKPEVFVVVPPGLEELAEEELAELGIPTEVCPGGLEVGGGLEAVYRTCLHSRLASRVLVRVGRARATTLATLATGVRNLGWRRWVHPKQPLQVHVTLKNSKLRRRDIVARKVELAIGDSLKRVRGASRGPSTPAGIWVRIDGEKAELSVDAAGEHLHRRGWALDRTEAPLRENLAAAVLRGYGWAPGEALVDPMCGSGTFLLEAATVLSGRAPGAQRSFAFQAFPEHDAERWAELQSQLGPLDVDCLLLGSDIDPEAVRAARANTRRAGVADRVSLEVADVADLEPPDALGWVVTNPPYGQRLSKGKAKRVVGTLGRVLRERFPGWGVALVLPPGLVGAARLPLQTVLTFKNGGSPVVVAAGVVPD